MSFARATWSVLLLAVLLPLGCSDSKKQSPDNSGARLPFGERIYKAYCAGCHGEAGRGDGPAGLRFTPRPTDFVSGPYKRGNSDEAIRRSIVEGVPPFMKPEPNLKKEELDALVEHVRKLARGEGTAP